MKQTKPLLALTTGNIDLICLLKEKCFKGQKMMIQNYVLDYTLEEITGDT